MSDTIEMIECPACGKTMHKVFMENAGVSLDVCVDGCGGMFFDNRELKKFDEHIENIEELRQAIQGKTFNKVDETSVRVCPVCGNNMVKNYVSIKKEITIDECYSCGGKFFDNGELEKMRDQYATEEDRKQDFLAATYMDVGSKIDAMELENQRRQRDCSYVFRVFRRLFW